MAEKVLILDDSRRATPEMIKEGTRVALEVRRLIVGGCAPKKVRHFSMPDTCFFHELANHAQERTLVFEEVEVEFLECAVSAVVSASLQRTLRGK